MASTTAPQPDLQSRIRTALYGLAVCDALGGPLEFGPRIHDPNKYVRDMIPNRGFGLPEGHFTDDTSMGLCLAVSFTKTAKQNMELSKQSKQVGSLSDPSASTKLTSKFHDPVDQAARYVRWLDDGYLSSKPGSAFDVGVQTSQALQYWRRNPDIATLDFVKQKFDFDWRGGNGSLMRVLPCGLVARTEDEAIELGRWSSEVTHSHRSCVDACGIYSMLVFWALRGDEKEKLVERLNSYFDRDTDREGAVKERLKDLRTVDSWKVKARDTISSSGYVVDSFEAALWALFGTDSFEQGAIEVVNLGDDADTVGAIYGGLAGAYYGQVQCIPQRWLESMKEFQIVEQTVQGLLDVIDSAP